MRLNISQEMIDFQKNDNFGKKIEEVIQEAIDFCEKLREEYGDREHDEGILLVTQKNLEIRKELNNTNIPEKLSSVVFARTGINVDFYFNYPIFGGAVLPLWINKNHIFLDQLEKGNLGILSQDKFAKEMVFNDKKGYINLKTAKVSGAFSEYKHLCEIDIYGLNRAFKAQADEITSVVLHEVGHIFATLEYSNRLEATNQVIAQISNSLKNKDDKQFAYYIKELGTEFKLSNDEIEELQKEKNRVILGAKLFKSYVKYVNTQLFFDVYSTNSSEQTADSFVARFGYGRQWVSYSYKFHKYLDDPEISKGFRIMNDIFVVLKGIFVGLIFIALIASGIVSGAIIVSFIWAIIGNITLLAYGEISRDFTYDEIKDRYKRMRNEYIEKIKTLDLDRNELKETIYQIDAMDDIIKKVIKYRDPIQKLSNFLFTYNRRIKDNVDIQRMMEDLISNDIFLKSAQIQTL